jgi:hypothetical protein
VRPEKPFYLVELKLFALQNVTLAGLQVERRIYKLLEVYGFAEGRRRAPMKLGFARPALISLTCCTTWGYLIRNETGNRF